MHTVHRLTVILMPLSAPLMRRKTRAACIVISFCCDGLITPPNIHLHIAAAHKSCAQDCALFQKCAPRLEQRLPAGDMETRAYSWERWRRCHIFPDYWLQVHVVVMSLAELQHLCARSDHPAIMKTLPPRRARAAAWAISLSERDRDREWSTEVWSSR